MEITSRPIIINNPSKKLLGLLNRFREHKISELEKLKHLDKCTFNVEVK